LCAGWHVPCRITTCWVWLLESPSLFICATVVCSLVVASYVANVSLCLGLLIWTATGLLVISLSSFVLLLLQLVLLNVQFLTCYVFRLPVVVCGCCRFCLYANANGVDSSYSYALLGFDLVVFLWFAKVVPTLAS